MREVFWLLAFRQASLGFLERKGYRLAYLESYLLSPIKDIWLAFTASHIELAKSVFWHISTQASKSAFSISPACHCMPSSSCTLSPNRANLRRNSNTAVSCILQSQSAEKSGPSVARNKLYVHMQLSKLDRLSQTTSMRRPSIRHLPRCNHYNGSEGSSSVWTESQETFEWLIVMLLKLSAQTSLIKWVELLSIVACRRIAIPERAETPAHFPMSEV